MSEGLEICLGWIIILVVGGGILIIVIYNKLVSKRNQVRNAWHQIDIHIRRRYDLISNIVETAKGYAKHEKETLENVTAARKLGINAKTAESAAKANNMLTDTLKSLFAVTEAYPDLKANQNFIALQEELRSTEDKLSHARQFYNDATMRYNTATEKFPMVIFARMLGFKRFEFWEIPEEERAVRGQIVSKL